VAELAETLVERYDGWTEADMETGREDDEQVVTDKAWNRLLAEKKLELTRLVEEGSLAGKRRGRGLLINNGSFYDWLGEPVPVCPDWGIGYDILPATRRSGRSGSRRSASEPWKSCPGRPPARSWIS